MPENEPTGKIAQWLGLNNVAEPAGLPLGWLAQADNVVIDNEGWVHRRRGLTEFLAGGHVAAVYALRDERALLAVIDENLVEVAANGSWQALIEDVGPGPYLWAENANTVVLMGSERAWRLEPSRAGPLGIELPDPVTLAPIPGSLPAGTYQVAVTLRDRYGVESGAREAATITVDGAQAILMQGIELRAGHTAQVYVSSTNGEVLYRYAATTSRSLLVDQLPGSGTPLEMLGLQPPPLGSAIAFHQGRLWSAVFDPSIGASAVFRSKPFRPHLFDVARDFIVVPGEVTVMGSTPNGLLIGTSREIFGWVPTEEGGERLAKLADYGAVRGSLDWLPDGAVIFWTARGAARALPFENLTDDRLSVEPGASAPGAVVELDGVRQYVVSPQPGGWAHNPAPVGTTPSLLTNSLLED